MSVENEKKGNGGKIILAIFITAMIGLLIFLLINATNNNPNNKATNNDIDGHWDSTVTTYAYVFIPKSNIDGLEVTFSIRDTNNKELQKIVKTVGNVKKGQQYTVSFNLSELQNFATLMDADYTKLTVTGGTKKLI